MRVPHEGEPPICDDRRLLRTLLSSPATAAVQVDAAGTVVDWSPGATELYGWTRDEALGRHADFLVPDERGPEWAEVRERLDGDGDVPVFGTLRRRRDGAVLEVDLDVVPLHEGPEVSGYLCVVRDARPTQRFEAVLQATAEQLRARFDESPVPQSLVDLSGRILQVNPAMEQLLGRDADELAGLDAVALYADEEQGQVLATLSRLAVGELSSTSEEHSLVRADGSRIRSVTHVTTVHDEQGRLLLAAAVQDLSGLRAAEQAVRSQARLFDAVLQSMPVAVFAYDLDGVCTSSRGAALESLGLRDGELVGVRLQDAYAHDPGFVAGLHASLRGEPASAVTEIGDRVWKGHYRPLRDDTGAIVGGLGVALDVTSAARAEQEVRGHESRLSALLRSASDVVTVVDAAGRLVYVSPAVRALLGYDDAAMFWRRASDFNHPDDHDVIRGAWDRVLAEPGACERFECRVLHADGSWRWTEHRFTNLLDDPDVRGVVVNLREITDQRRAEAELRRLAVEDGLTGLANRTLLLDRVEQALRRGERRGERTGIVLLDVRGTGRHNERLGHAGGDVLLQLVARRLAGSVRPTDSVARVGGDEFAVLYEDATSVEDLRARASALLDAFAEPFTVGGAEEAVAMRAGVALSPADDAGALLAAAERALVGSTGEPQVSTRPATVDPGAVAALRRAIRDDELRLHFQPVVDLASGAVRGVEALVRWQHPERGLLPPAQFVPLAEASGLVIELGAWVLRSACDASVRWQAAGRDLAVGINLSPLQLEVPGFADVVADAVRTSGAAVGSLVLEVTESTLLDSATALRSLRDLVGLGVRLALDDFGTGFSSLTYLKRFPVDLLKIDRSFVAGLGVDPDDEAIVASVVSLGRRIGKAVVAEGVETPAQLQRLSRLGVEQAQGFLWSPGLPLDALETWLDGEGAAVVAAAPQVRPEEPAPAVEPGSDEERIMQLHAEGASLSTIAAALNAEGRRTSGGTRWHTRSVARVVADLRG